MAVMTALIVLVSAEFVAGEWRDYRSAGEAAHLTRAIGDLLRAGEKLTLSPGPQNAALLADDAVADQARAEIGTQRQDLGRDRLRLNSRRRESRLKTKCSSA